MVAMFCGVLPSSVYLLLVLTDCFIAQAIQSPFRSSLLAHVSVLLNFVIMFASFMVQNSVSRILVLNVDLFNINAISV